MRLRGHTAKGVTGSAVVVAPGILSENDTDKVRLYFKKTFWIYFRNLSADKKCKKLGGE